MLETLKSLVQNSIEMIILILGGFKIRKKKERYGGGDSRHPEYLAVSLKILRQHITDPASRLCRVSL